MHAEREFVDIGTLSSKIENTNLWVGNTAVESALGVWLVLAVAIAAGWSSGHREGKLWCCCTSCERGGGGKEGVDK